MKEEVWRVDKDQDRSCSPCKVRKMTKADWDKYGQPTGIKRISSTASVPEMKRQGINPKEKLSKEKLIEECRMLGTDRVACEVIAEKYGYKHYSRVSVRIRTLGIKEILEGERDG